MGVIRVFAVLVSVCGCLHSCHINSKSVLVGLNTNRIWKWDGSGFGGGEKEGESWNSEKNWEMSFQLAFTAIMDRWDQIDRNKCLHMSIPELELALP